MSNHPLLAYVGPGPGLTMFWAFLALMGTVALAVLSLLIWPIRVLMRRIRGAPPEEAQPPADPSDVGATSEDVNRTTTSR